MLNRDEIIFAYRLILGREPENSEVVARYAAEFDNLDELRRLFFNSSEFQTQWQRLALPRAAKPPLSGPPMQVEVTTDPESLHCLFQRIAAQWHTLGKEEPLWSVVTQERFRSAVAGAAEREAFYASGEDEVAILAAILHRAGRTFADFSVCFELGCGVGRVTGALAKRFSTVHAWDVSAHHLEHARARYPADTYPNIRFTQIETPQQFASLPRFDFFYSRIVLQHNPPPVMAFMLAHILAQLQPGGLACFQVPTYKAGYRFTLDAYWQQNDRPTMEMHVLPQSAVFSIVAQTGCRVLEVREDDAIGISATAISNTFLVEKPV